MPSFDLCQLEFDPRADFAIVHLQQQPAQIKRAFLLPMKEQTVTFDNIFTEKHRLKNRLSTQARLFLNMFAGLDCQQARLLASSTQFSAHRYISREDLNKIRKTEVTIPVENFELYHVHLNTQIVISLRELRSILNFMESCGLSLSLHFDRAGRPLIVALEDNLDFGAEFVLATLDDGEREREQQRTVPDQQQANLVLLAQNPSQRVQMTPGMEPESRPSIAKRLLALASLQTEEEANENRYSASFC